MKNRSLFILSVAALILFLVGSYSVNTQLSKIQNLNTLGEQNVEDFNNVFSDFERNLPH